MIAIPILGSLVMIFLGYLVRKDAESAARLFLLGRQPPMLAIRWFRLVGILWMSGSAMFLVILGMQVIFSTNN